MAETNFEKMLADFDSFARDHGYVRSREWCAIRNVSRGMPNAWINCGRFEERDYFKVGHIYYISVEKDGYNKCDNEFKQIIDDFEGFMRKHGYIRTAEYAYENYHSPGTVRNWYQRGLLEFPDIVKMGEVYYMKKDIDMIPRLRKRGPKPKHK